MGGGVFCFGNPDRRGGGGSCASGNSGERRGGLKNDPIRQGVWIFSGITQFMIVTFPFQELALVISPSA